MTATPFTAACVQITSGGDWRENVTAIAGWVRQAKVQGADICFLPENSTQLSSDRVAVRDSAPPQENHPSLAALRDLARRHNMWLLIGSLSVGIGMNRDGTRRTVARSFLIAADGSIQAAYDKIHMFDVRLGQGETFTESDTVTPGRRAKVGQTPWGGLGMSVCYDIRFPHLYRDLARAGAAYLTVPAAFTRPTGAAHWEILLRARAIENGAYVFAPAQCGEHPGGRLTWGHSLIIDPWGEVLADGGEAPGVIVAKIDPEHVRRARDRIPSLSHDVDYEGP